MTISAQQCRAARGILGWSQADLRAATDGQKDENGKPLKAITHKTLSDFEANKTTPYRKTLERIREALEGAGVVFVEPNGFGAGVRLRDKGK